MVVDKKLTYEERPEKIVDRKDQVLRTLTIPYVVEESFRARSYMRTRGEDAGGAPSPFRHAR